jgi:hypothetical protein
VSGDQNGFDSTLGHKVGHKASSYNRQQQKQGFDHGLLPCSKLVVHALQQVSLDIAELIRHIVGQQPTG